MLLHPQYTVSYSRIKMPSGEFFLLSESVLTDLRYLYDQEKFECLILPAFTFFHFEIVSLPLFSHIASLDCPNFLVAL
jgi:hypothetical protein